MLRASTYDNNKSDRKILIKVHYCTCNNPVGNPTRVALRVPFGKWVLLGQNLVHLNDGSILIRNGKTIKNILKYKFYTTFVPFKQVKVNFQK